MSDIEKAKIIHDLRHNFQADDLIINGFINQIKDSNVKNQIERFFNGYSIEDKFKFLFSGLPWVVLVHGLYQEQHPAVSKQSFQVTDYIVFFETGKKDIRPLLIDVKSVKGDSQSVEIMKKQANACIEYAKVLDIPFLYSVYWEKYQTWTLVPLENFESKAKNFKLKISEAMKNDLSIILGDTTFLINRPIYRKIVYDKDVVDKSRPYHDTFGTTVIDSVSTDGTNFMDMQALESAVLDSSMTSKIINREQKGHKMFVTEVIDSPYYYKLSTLILRHLVILSTELTENNVYLSGRSIIDFFIKLQVVQSFQVPQTKTRTSDLLYKQAFEGSWVYENYSDFYKVSNDKQT